jgi:hypothetical protein
MSAAVKSGRRNLRVERGGLPGIMYRNHSARPIMCQSQESTEDGESLMSQKA